MPVGRSFDITLNGKGYMLARGQFKGRAWRRTGQPNAIQPRSTDADLQRNALRPELDFVAVYDDFSGGYGDAYRNPQSPNRIHWAENMEVRFPRQAIHCQRVRTIGNVANQGATYFDPIVGDAGIQGTDDRNASWMMQSTPLDQGSRLRTSSLQGRGAVLIFGQGTSAADQGYAEFYDPTGFPPLFTSGGGSPSLAEFVRLQKTLSSGTGSLGSSFFARPFAPARGAIFGSFAYGGGNAYLGFPDFNQIPLDGAGATRSAIPGYVFAVAGQRMWRGFGASGAHINMLQSVSITDDPMVAANWSATLHIGNGQTDAQDMIALDDQIFVAMQDGLYAGDTSGTFFNVLGDMVGQPHPDNGRNMVIHDRGVVYPYSGGLLLYQQLATAAIARNISPVENSHRSPLRGRFRAVTSYGGWLYGGLVTLTANYIVAGRDRGDGIYVWNPLQRLPSQALAVNSGVRQLMVDAISTPSGGGVVASGNALLSPRFWVSTEASIAPGTPGDSPIFWWGIPLNDGNPLGASSFSGNYVGSARLDFGRDNRGAPDTLKVLRRLDINTDLDVLASGNRYCDVYYTLDGGTRTLLGRAQTSPRTTLYFPAAAGSFTTCYDWELSIESFASASAGPEVFIATSPVYRSFVTHGAFLSEGSDEITAVFDISDRRANRHGTPMRSAAAQLTELRSLPGGPPVQLVDLTGAQNWVAVQRSIDEAETYQEGSDEPEVAATVKLSVLRFS